MHADYRNVSYVNKNRVLVICCRNIVLFSFADGGQKLMLVPYKERNAVIYFYFLFRKSYQRA